jgi:hypothetical protein
MCWKGNMQSYLSGSNLHLVPAEGTHHALSGSFSASKSLLTQILCCICSLIQEAKKVMPITSKINVSPLVDEKPAPMAEEPLTYSNKTVSMLCFYTVSFF